MSVDPWLRPRNMVSRPYGPLIYLAASMFFFSRYPPYNVQRKPFQAGCPGWCYSSDRVQIIGLLTPQVKAEFTLKCRFLLTTTVQSARLFSVEAGTLMSDSS